MWTDVVDLRDFYASPMGRSARRIIARRIEEIWPDVTAMSVLGLGYATPYLAAFREKSERTIALMPGAQGVIHWPLNGPGAVALSDETAIPLPDNSIDRILLVHALESSESLRPMLREIWRVLAGNGRILVVAPNRRGLWARRDITPFGHGHPYSSGQLSRLLRDTLFTPQRSEKALIMPPLTSPMALSSANALEEAGYRWFSTFAGVILMEASKQIYAASTATYEQVNAKVLSPIRRKDVAQGKYQRTQPITPPHR